MGSRSRGKRIPRLILAYIAVAAVVFMAFILGAALGRDAATDENKSTGPSASASSPAPVSSSAASAAKVTLPDVDSANRSSSDAVARLAVQSMTTWDTSRDQDETDAVDRTKPVFDPVLAEHMPTGGEDTDPWPKKVAEADGFSTPQVSDYRIATDYKVNPPRTDSVDGRKVETTQFLVTWNWTNPTDGSRMGSKGQRIYTVTTVADGDQWSVIDYSFRPTTGH